MAGGRMGRGVVTARSMRATRRFAVRLDLPATRVGNPLRLAGHRQGEERRGEPHLELQQGLRQPCPSRGWQRPPLHRPGCCMGKPQTALRTPFGYLGRGISAASAKIE